MSRSETAPGAGAQELCVEGCFDAAIIARFDATLGLPHIDGTLPLGLHWCCVAERAATADLGADGHPPPGDFLPATDLPRRMWAGGEITVLQPLQAGADFRRVSRVTGRRETEGRSGRLCFVTVEHELFTAGGLALRERQDIVYRSADISGPPRPLPPAPEAAAGDLIPGPELLFRYSALTFNAHRIHYDADYARRVENYPALVVHGPLQATLLAAAAATRLGQPLRRFRYRGMAPAFVNIPLQITEEPAGSVTAALHLSSRQYGRVCMLAEAD